MHFFFSIFRFNRNTEVKSVITFVLYGHNGLTGSVFVLRKKTRCLSVIPPQDIPDKVSDIVMPQAAYPCLVYIAHKNSKSFSKSPSPTYMIEYTLFPGAQVLCWGNVVV